MNNKRIFVSGGAGVIGREIVPRLLALGAIVLVGDLKPRPAEFPASVQYRQGDLNDMSEAEFAAFAPDIFIHLAATFERSTESLAFWEENFRHNVQLSHHLMSLTMSTESVKRVVFASSYLIYDPARYQFDTPQSAPVALREGDPILPRNLTGMAKLGHEIELRFADNFHSARFSTVCARIFRGYGRNSRDVISRWIRLLLDGQAITVYQPEGIFDYVYAADTAEGLIRLAANPQTTGIVNLGTGRARRVQDVVDILARHFPKLQRIDEASPLPYEASQADISLLQASTGWQPAYDLERAIPEMIAFEQAGRQRDTPPASPPVVLLTSASRKIPLLRALQKAARKLHPAARVIAGDLDPQALSGLVADDFWPMPRLDSVSIDQLLAECRERGITDILPSRDGELLFWASHAERFAAAGIHVLTSSPASLERCLDKLAFARFGVAHDLPFIVTASTPDAISAHRLVVKERHGAGSRSLGLDLDHEAATHHAAGLTDPIFQAFVSGEEISIDAWLDCRGRAKGVVLRRRERVVNGESQVTTTFRNVALEALASRMLEALELRGPVVMQAMLDDAGGMQVIECNPRFGGASTTALAAGLDSLYWSLLEARGQSIDELPFLRSPVDIRQIRVPADIHVACSGS